MRSGVTWQIENGSLRRGLTSVGGIGEKAADAIADARPFSSLAELRGKVSPMACNAGVLKKLGRARALMSIGIEDEQELIEELASITKNRKTIKETP
jgi:DNA polymerase III alpha subunit